MARIVTHSDTWDNGNVFSLYGIGDLHLGSPSTDEEALKALIAKIADNPLARWVGMGDYGDLITVRDRRWEPGVLDRRYLEAVNAEGGIPSETVAHAAELLEPIRGKCMGFIEGNHETAVRKYTDRSIGLEIAKELRLQHLFLGYSGWVRWRFVRKSAKSSSTHTSVRLHLHHGWQAGRRPGAPHNQAQIEKAYYPNADIILRGHSHQHLGDVFDCQIGYNRHVRSAQWAYAMTGTFKRGIDHPREQDPSFASYEERKGFGPKTTLGPPEILVEPQVVGTNNPTKYDFNFRVVLG